MLRTHTQPRLSPTTTTSPLQPPTTYFLGGEGKGGGRGGGLWLSGFLLVLWSVTSAADHTFDTKGTSDRRQRDQVIAFKFVYMAEEA